MLYKLNDQPVNYVPDISLGMNIIFMAIQLAEVFILMLYGSFISIHFIFCILSLKESSLPFCM